LREKAALRVRLPGPSSNAHREQSAGDRAAKLVGDFHRQASAMKFL
jgi:hypothetical protein